MSTDNDIQRLFPLLSSAPSRLCPKRFPGITHETKLAVTKALKANHVDFNGFRDEQGRHNHMSHQLLATYALGGAAPLYEAIYKMQKPELRAAFPSPEAITKENFREHLGDKRYYDAYMNFFHDTVLNQNFASVLEDYIFSRSASLPEAGPPQSMPNRLLARLFHPIIYLGYGLEFGIPGLVAEGLAQTAVHPRELPGLLLPTDYDTAAKLTSAVSALTLKSSDVGDGEGTSLPKGQSKANIHAFAVLAEVVRDDQFKPNALGLKAHKDQYGAVFLLERVGEQVGSIIVEHAEGWLPDSADARTMERKVEELAWLVTVLYGVCGYSDGGFLGDFYLMHAVTSSLFLPSFLAYLSPASSIVLLRTFFRTTLAWYIARGRPAIRIRDFYAGTRASSEPTPQGKLGSEASANRWLPLIQHALVHGDDHLPKTQRALAHFARIYGDREAGSFSDFDGVELLDGSLFVRVAELTRKRVDDPQDGFVWDFGGWLE